MKLLDGSLGGASGNTGDYGAKFGVAVAGFGSITSDIAGIQVKTALNASGDGAENAVWDKTGKILTINLAKDKTYTQSQINDLIAKADVEKAATGSPANVTLTLENGIHKASAAQTGTTVAGKRATGDAVSMKTIMGITPGETVDYADTIKLTRNSYGLNADSVDKATKISIQADVGAGKENVTQAAAGEYVVHVATGVEYTEKDLESIMKKGGLDFEVSLTSTIAPDGDANHVTKFNVKGTAVDFELGTDGAGLGKDKVGSTGEGLTFQIGANGVEDQRVTLTVDDMSSAAIGVANADVSTRDAANEAIEMVDSAVKKVSMQRAGLGALQNRLEYTVNNLTTTNENLTNAESQIRDTDMATEMINYTKFNILQQASQAMLAQANQQPQAVLQLLG